MIRIIFAAAMLCALLSSPSVACNSADIMRPCQPNYRAASARHVRGVLNSSFGLVARARSYLGTNPTGWARVWCGRFMAMIAPEAAAKIRNPNTARSWAALPRIGHCQVEAGVVLWREGGGGHVGVVSACTPEGPSVVSGNHGSFVGEGVFPASRVLAYVSI